MINVRLRVLSIAAVYVFLGLPVSAQTPSPQLVGTAIVGDFRVLELWDGNKRYKKGECIERVLVKNPKPKKKGGAELLGGRILSAPLTHHYKCTKVATGREPLPRYWFEVEGLKGEAFQLNAAAARKGIRAFCRSKGKSTTQLVPADRKRRELRKRHRFDGQCK